MENLLIYLITSVEFLTMAVGIFICSYIAIWLVDTEIQEAREQGHERGLQKGVEIGRIKSEVLK